MPDGIASLLPLSLCDISLRPEGVFPKGGALGIPVRLFVFRG